MTNAYSSRFDILVTFSVVVKTHKMNKILNMVLSSSCSEFDVESKIQSVHDLSIPSKLAFFGVFFFASNWDCSIASVDKLHHSILIFQTLFPDIHFPFGL